ncbi:thioredoxin-like domain-containing protein [Arenibacter sp. GZD96]|uniref:TlpA family protein disulfide reductase n=1 Tax=Aurantibrevibacter litoralis TaxID=3106030 RepID=UPI002AFEC826|nr:redoxin domain-containing protein [Arenibacter sp. GZD-96]MEA1787164.1 thioredoxin-like domain-containing protein [Arenibacter sp. GZD-96]
MKRKIKVLILLLFFVISGFLGFQFYITLQKKAKQNDQMTHLPEFSLMDTMGKVRTKANIVQNRWTVFVFFNSECHYCQEEAQQLKSQKDKIDKTQFVWVSSEPYKTITNFQNLYGLGDHPNITFLQDYNAEFTKLCNIKSTPHFLVYDTKGKIVISHKGAWRIDKLLDNIANEFKTP